MYCTCIGCGGRGGGGGGGGGGFVHIHPPSAATHNTIIPRACRIALRLLIGQEMSGRLLISTKALCSDLDSSVREAFAHAVFLTSKNQM